MRVLSGILVVLLLAGLGGWGGYRYWPREIPFKPRTITPVWLYEAGRQRVTWPGGYIVADVGHLDDEVFAYLMFDYLRGKKLFWGSEVLLTSEETPQGPVYPIQVRPENDLLTAIPMLARAQAEGLIYQFDWTFLAGQSLVPRQEQTRFFNAAYKAPANQSLDGVPREDLEAYVRRFIQFKSRTDGRVRTWKEAAPTPLSTEQAHRLAADILAVAEFYELPLEFFLGIGAMENNYMNVTGDLEHAVWKRRAEKGDVVLRRGRGRVLVLNQASGVWQITRETLRAAHRLYLKDQRDYSLLPERLRPPRELNLDELDSQVLTTYAGLLFRSLLDRFGGDVATAVGAYNGGPGNPNMRYEAGVRTAAEHARQVLEHAAARNGRSLADVSVGKP